MKKKVQQYYPDPIPRPKIEPKIKEYGLYTNRSKMLPSMIDGLIPIQRRLLFMIYIMAKNKFINISKILDECVKRWTSEWFTDDTMLWIIQNDLVNIDVKKKSIKLNNFINEIAFKYIDYVEMKPEETHLEPINIPTMIPFCLMICESSKRSGFKTNIPHYSIIDIIKRLLYLKGINDNIIIRPIIAGCVNISSDDDCEQILLKGCGKIDIQGKYKTHDDEIIVYGWPPGKTFDTLLKNIDEYKGWNLISNKDINWSDISDDNKQMRTVFRIVKKRNKKDISYKMKEAVLETLKDTIFFNICTIHNDSLILSSVDSILLGTYDYYKETFQTYIEENIENIKKEIENTIEKSSLISIDKEVKQLKTLENCLNNIEKLCLAKYKKIEQICHN